MNDSPRRFDSWAQWAGVLLVLLGSFWWLSGTLSRIEQQLRDETTFHESETRRLDFIEKEVLPYIVHGIH